MYTQCSLYLLKRRTALAYAFKVQRQAYCKVKKSLPRYRLCHACHGRQVHLRLLLVHSRAAQYQDINA